MLTTLKYADCDEGRPSRITVFDHVTEFVDVAKRRFAKESAAASAWAEMEREEAITAALNGDDSFVPGAMSVLEAVDAAIPPTVGRGSVRSPYGGRVDMSDWLTGSPTPMRRKARRETETGTVRVFLPFGPSASLGSAVLGPRGNAIMALVMKIQQTRSVELYLYDETQDDTNSQIPYYFLIGVDCRPLSLAHVGFAISHPAFFRHLGLAAEHEMGARAERWPMDMHGESYAARRDSRLDIQPCDVLLSSATDWNPLIRQPIEWIKSELQRIGILREGVTV